MAASADNENGIREAVVTLKDQQKDVFKRLLDLEINGSSQSKHNYERINELKREYETMDKKLDDLRITFYKALGVATGVMLVSNFLVRLL